VLTPRSTDSHRYRRQILRRRALKNRILLENYYLPGDLEETIANRRSLHQKQAAKHHKPDEPETLLF
jgi:hypothetical protein